MGRYLAAILTILSITIGFYIADATAQVQVWNGDLDGSTNANKIVTGAKGQPLPTSGSGTLSWDGGAWYFGPAISPALAGQALFTDDAGASTTWAYPHGDVDASATDPGALTVNAIQGFGVSTSVPSSGNVLTYSSGLWRPSNIATTSVTPGSAGTFLVTNGTPATAWSTLDTFDTVHGNFTAGGGGTDPFTTIGVYTGGGGFGAAYFLQHGGAAGNTNYSFLGDGATLTALNMATSSMTGYWIFSGDTTSGLNLTALSGTSLTYGSGVSSASFGTGASGATMALKGGNGVTGISITAPGATAGTASVSISGSLAYTTRTITSSVTIDTTTTDRIIFADCSTSSITITLPTPTAGRVLTVIDQKNNCNASSGKEVTLARHGTESIDGSAANVTITTSGARTDIFSDGTNWFTHMGTKAN